MGRLRQVLDDFRKEVRKPKRRWIALASILLIAVCGYLVVQSLGKNYHYQEGQRALEANDFEAARKHLLLALKSDPQNTDVLLLLARTARHAGDFNEATEYLAKCRRLGGIPEAIKLEYDLQQVQRGYLLSSLENHLWAYVKVNHPDSVEILDALARGYMHSVRLERACATFDELLKRRPDDVQALLLRGRLQLHKSKLQEAAADFRRILDELDPNNDEARRNLAKILVDFSQFPEAFPLYQGLAKQHPDDPEVALALIRCQLALKAPEAPALLDRLAGRFPDNAEIQVERAKMDM